MVDPPFKTVSICTIFREISPVTPIIDMKGEPIMNNITLLPDDKSALIKAMKIGYYKDFYKRGLITAEQLEMLISMQNNSNHTA